MSAPAATQTPSWSKQRLYDWIKTVLVVIVAGPPIGGFVFGLFMSAMTLVKGLDEWQSVPAAVFVSMIMSYVIGIPVAAVALVLFLILYRFMTRGTSYLAVICALVSCTLLIFLNDAGQKAGFLRFGFRDFAISLGMFGIPSAISALVCWRITRPFHRLS